MLSSALSRRALSWHTCQMPSVRTGHGHSLRSSRSSSMVLLSGGPLGTDLLWIGALSGISPSRLSSFEAGVAPVAAATSPSPSALVTGVLAGAICLCACGSTTGGDLRSTVVYALSLRPRTPPPRSSASLSSLRLSRLELIGGSGRTAGRYASAARAFISPTAFEQARGGALGAGGGRVGFAGGGLF